jgi:hypothetical protein
MVQDDEQKTESHETPQSLAANMTRARPSACQTAFPRGFWLELLVALGIVQRCQMG